MPALIVSRQRVERLARAGSTRLPGTVSAASRSLPIRAPDEEVQRAWREQRTSLLDVVPASQASLVRGIDQGDWGTTYTGGLKLAVALPRTGAVTAAGKVVRRLKALAEFVP